MNLLTKVVVLVLLGVGSVFVLLHVLPWLLGSLAMFGAYKLYQHLHPPFR
ncbi:MAG: hypothetical protein RL514_3155 [Verrucomicrobiota bacterium]|jgi:hypothetical protein